MPRRVYDERTSLDPSYPSVLPSTGDSPEYDSFVHRRHDSPVSTPGPEEKYLNSGDVSLSFAPPGPAYMALKNNVSTIEMELSCQKWKSGTGEFVPHHVLGSYIQDAAVTNGVLKSISFNTRVEHVEKQGDKWSVAVDKLSPKGNDTEILQESKVGVLVEQNDVLLLTKARPSTLS